MRWCTVSPLYWPDQPGETSHRLAERLALFLAQRGAEARDLYQDVKKGYGLRSKIVHGMRGIGGKGGKGLDPETGDRHLHEVQEWLRESLCRILLCKASLETFSGKGRDRFLNELAFR